MDQPQPELRTDWLTGRSVVVAENRALRPNDFAGEVASATGSSADETHVATCPFCIGNESHTPPAVYEKLDEQGRWQIRVVSNMFPAVMPPDEPAITPILLPPSGSACTFRAPAIGEHEVIIESRWHVSRMSALSIAELRDVLDTYAARLRHWRDSDNWDYGLVFKNQGRRAGASIAHLHSQLIALPFIPAAIDAEQSRAAQMFSQEKECPYCHLIGEEKRAGERIVLVRDGFVAFCPFASWQPHEVWVMPITHEPSFEATTSVKLERLAKILHALIGRIEPILGDADYNLLVRTAPWTAGRDDWSHWRIELLPRVNSFAGLEVATGIYINPLAPENAARQLRPQ